MARRYKTTGFARIFILLIIITPIAFFTASYINGTDPMEVISGWFGGEKSTEFDHSEKTTTKSQNSSIKDSNATISDLQNRMDRLEKDVEYYKSETEKYKKLLEACQRGNNQ